MAKTSPITIVIPAYNRAHTLPRTLASVARQTLMPARIVLVDNDSSDSTLVVMQEWAAAHDCLDVIVLTEKKRGACAARNCGLAKVETDFVMFFDSDDEMLPGHVADFSAAIMSHPDIDIFGRSIIYEMLDGKRRKLYFTARDPIFNHLFRSCLSTQRMVVRTSLIHKAGGWNEALRAWDDFELGVRLLLMTDKIMSLQGSPTVITYQQAESLTGTSFSSHPGRWEEALDQIEELLVGNSRKDLIKWVNCRRMILAAQYYREYEAGDPDGDVCLSGNLYGKVMASTGESWRLRFVYWHNRTFDRLTWLLAKIIM